MNELEEYDYWCKQIKERQIYFMEGKTVNGAKQEIEPKNIMTVEYASKNDIFLFEAYGLGQEGKETLVKTLINEMQSGTNIERKIVKVVGDTYFVY